jgi:phosphatidylglycerophosphate synthase
MMLSDWDWWTTTTTNTFYYVVIAVVGVAFGVFAVRELFVGRHVSARIQKQGGSPLLGLLPMEFAYWCLKPIGRLAAGLRISPDVFSWLCLTIGFLSGVAAAAGRISLAGGLAIISALFDALDGMVARNRGVASDAGEVLDAAIDRYAEFFLLAGLTVYYRFNPWAMALALSALLGSFMVSYSQAKAEAMGTEVPKGWMRRPERAVYMGVGTFLGPLLVDWFEPFAVVPLHYPVLLAMVMVAVFSNAAAVKRYAVLYRAIRQKEQKAKNSAHQ